MPFDIWSDLGRLHCAALPWSLGLVAISLPAHVNGGLESDIPDVIRLPLAPQATPRGGTRRGGPTAAPFLLCGCLP